MKIRHFTTILASAMALMALRPASAETAAGYQTVHSKWPYAELEEKLKAAIVKNKMNPVNRASASDGAKGRGVSIRGDAVIGVFRNDFAVRMLEANVDAGIEAPVRLHLVEEADGTTTIRYYKPSALFGRYEGDAIKALGKDLDGVFEQIVRDAAGE